MGAFVLAWLTGETIIIWRSVAGQKSPPWPGEMLLSSGAYALLAIVAEFGPGARNLAVTIAWGLNIASLVNLPGMPPGKNQAGWWAHVTAVRVPGTQVLPGGGCKPGAGSSAGAGQSSAPTGPPGSAIGRALGQNPGQKMKQGDQSGQGQTYPGGCPKGQMRVGNRCYKVTG